MIPPLITLLVTGATLGLIQLKVSRPMLLADRFWPEAGGLAGAVEILLLAMYAALLCRGLLDPTTTARWRRRAWWIFSVVFFGQLALGMAGVEQCLMRPDRLHFPIPALIAAGPLYRQEGFFMIILFICTVLVVGPAWCSHLCYMGAWDQAAADGKRKPGRLPAWHQYFRGGFTAGVLLTALIMGLLGVPTWMAGGAALLLGITGVVMMFVWSRRAGVMTHCVTYCPMGLLAVWLGKISPFRLHLASGCDGCMRCRLACRFAALEQEDVERRRPGNTCTLCGDCLVSCDGGALEYHFLGLKPRTARILFVVLVSTLMACFLGIARL
jgi:polyferredoxin